MVDNRDAVWKALADSTRRRILSLLREGPLTTTEIVSALPHLTRFGIMKHMSVLRDVDLITVREEGPRRFNSLNVVPIRCIYEQLVDDYQDLWAKQLTGLKRELESRTQDTKKGKPQ